MTLAPEDARRRTPPDTGTVLLDGEPVAFHGPADIRDAGVAVIHQEPTTDDFDF
jgi:ABC-type sugar transport system ATPase subunit